MYDKLRPLLFALNAEQAHAVSLRGLDLAHQLQLTRFVAEPPQDLPTRAFGIDFPNPVGLAAGLDKNGEHIDALGALGFGFIEIGTVTPQAQLGKPKPRLFRLAEHEAIINRMGFNNAGVNAVVRNIEQSSYQGVLGVNIGKNADTPDERAVDDYLTCLRAVYWGASYITVNISSPNTKGLRDLQQPRKLHSLISALLKERDMLAARYHEPRPLLLKIAPDLGDSDMDAMADILKQVTPDGLICSNTTVNRQAVTGSAYADEQGGLSGRPLRAAADRVLQGMHQRLGERVPIVGVGGILEGDDAAGKFHHGAKLVQLYTGLVYRGPHLIGECVNELRRQFAESA